VYIERQQWLSIALDVAFPYVWEGSVFAKLIRGGLVKVCSDAQHPSCSTKADI
jgi:hypothetical protein